MRIAVVSKQANSSEFPADSQGKEMEKLLRNVSSVRTSQRCNCYSYIEKSKIYNITQAIILGSVHPLTKNYRTTT